jgi:hypothetical protein
VTWFHANAVALWYLLIPVLLLDLPPGDPASLLKVTKSVAEASSAAS